jgi:hypothetical protein
LALTRSTPDTQTTRSRAGNDATLVTQVADHIGGYTRADADQR